MINNIINNVTLLIDIRSYFSKDKNYLYYLYTINKNISTKKISYPGTEKIRYLEVLKIKIDSFGFLYVFEIFLKNSIFLS